MLRLLGFSKQPDDRNSIQLAAGGPPTELLKASLSALLQAQASVVEGLVRDQGHKLQQAEALMAEAVSSFGAALKQLDVLAKDQYQLAMDLRRVLEVSLDDGAGSQSVEEFTRRILGNWWKCTMRNHRLAKCLNHPTKNRRDITAQIHRTFPAP